MKPYHCARFTEMNVEEYVELMFMPMTTKEVVYKIVNPNDVQIKQCTKKEEKLQ